MQTRQPDWQVLRDEITAQTVEACRKFEAALGTATEPPPREIGEALEDAANEYLNLFDEISALHRQRQATQELR